MHNIHYTPKQLATDAKVRDPEYSDFFALFEVNYSCVIHAVLLLCLLFM